ncbi:MAG: DUF2911 domain-containing protein [Reichenbachiella sp.]
MKNTFLKLSPILFSLLVLISFDSTAQKPKASPFKTTSAEVNGKTITITYSAPYKKDRAIYGGLVPYGKVWRTGANECTTIEISSDVTIGGKNLAAGKYSLFTIPNEGQWTIIINEDAKQWGHYSYKESKDVLRFRSTPKATDQTEQFTITLSEEGVVSIVWDTTKVNFNIE